MSLLGGPAEPPVRPQDPDAHAQRPPGRLLPVEAHRPIRVRDEDGQPHPVAGLVHPARIKKSIDTTKMKKRRFIE